MDSLHRPISPPHRKRERGGNQERDSEEPDITSKKQKQKSGSTTDDFKEHTDVKNEDVIRVIRSPIRLYRIRDLPNSENVDTVTLRELFAPSSTLDEIWTVNFMTDMPFLRGLIRREDEGRVKIRVIHGYWRQGDESRKIMEAGVWSKNVKLIAAYLPDAFGTHHSKVIVLFRTDDTAQVLVHTANMIPFDHENMTNAVFATDPLPLKTEITAKTDFESALMEYFSFYSRSRTGELVSRLKQHDFSSVKAHFIASVPGKFEGESANKWGLGRLKKLLHSIKSHPRTELFGQFSSIGSFGKNDTWLGPQFHQALATSNTPHPLPQLRLIYPTLKNVQQSLNGYRSGTSIHWTISSPAHEAQEQYMRPLLRQWYSVKAGRERAAPHIKTYGRLTPDNTFDWFMMTSANLSKPAWGAQEGKPPNTGLRIRSFEAGVLLDPTLYGEDTVFVPTYKSDLPSEEQISWANERGYKTVVAIRMAWDIPFRRYESSDVPWVKNRTYSGVDWLGMPWD